MATTKKLLQAAAGNAGGAGLNVEEVFSTYLYEGNGSTQTITNNVDLSGEGGLVWVKKRSASASHGLYDTERGANKLLISDNANAQATYSGVNSFSSTGFSLGSGNEFNQNSQDFASWSFRKAPKFFDVVTYTGNGVAGRTVSHSLNSVPGCIIVKATNNARSWAVYHRGTDSTAPEDYGLYLNETTDRSDDAQLWNDTAPTSTEFTVGTDGDTNVSGRTYVAYLFAHNNNDGEFGPDGDADIIKCGSYSNSGSAWSVDLGFEPQFLIRKLADGTSDWQIADTMRGLFPKGQNAKNLTANTSNAENNAAGIQITPTGIEGTGNGASGTWIYIAIRRGPMAVPESATDVFAPNFYGTSGYVGYLGAPADMHMLGYRSGNSQNAIVSSRLVQSNKALVTSSNAAEITSNSSWDNMLGVTPVGTTLTTLISWTWRRAPKYMDVVAYTGDGTAGRTVSHNLGVAPEMMWVKRRDGAQNWRVYHKGLNGGSSPEDYFINLNTTSAAVDNNTFWNDTAPTETNFTVGTQINASSNTYIAYLFATLAGISKVGSVTHSGTTNVDCGFTSGARFVLLKRTDATGDWYVWDSVRGIVAGNDPYLLLNSSAAEVTNTDYIDPLSSGFTITSSFTAGDYIFYAIA